MKRKGLKPYKQIEAYVPQRALPAARLVYRAYVKALCWYAGLQDRRKIEQTGLASVPPASLRYRVHGSPNLEGFLRMGKRCSEDIEAALQKVGKELNSFEDVLDFGCGCGRTLIWFEDRAQTDRWHGTDIDAEAISWCRGNLGFVEFGANGALPPLEYAPGTFGLIYAISVFTHLNEEYQFYWLEELRRIIRPGGVVLLTVSGRRVWRDLPEEQIADIKKNGFQFVASNTAKGIFPEWYQNAYHTKEYVLDRYSEYFDVLDYIPKGMSNRQDIVVLQRS